MSNKLSYKIITGSFWTITSHFTSLVIILITNVILARILSPREFGQLGIVMFFITFSNIFADGGLPGALVRKKEVNDIDFSTVFLFNLFTSIFFFALLIAISSPIAAFYQDDALKELITASASIILFSAFQTVQNIKLVRDMKFRKKSLFTLASSIIGSALGILMAYFYKAGVWALVLIPIATSFSLMLLLWIFEGFYFRLRFSYTAFKDLFSFGINTTLYSILNTTFDNIYQLVLGKMFSLKQTGYYYQAKKIQDVPANVVNNVSQGVLFSALSKMQDNKEHLFSIYRNIISIFTPVMGLISLLVFVFADQIVLILLGSEWGNSAIYMKLLTIATFFFSQELVNKAIFKVFNRTKVMLNLELIKKIAQSITVLIGVYFKSIYILLGGFIITSIASYFLNFVYTRKIIGLKSSYEIVVVTKTFLIAVAISVSLSLIHQWTSLGLVVSFFFCVGTYLLLIEVFNVLKLKENFYKIKGLIKNI